MFADREGNTFIKYQNRINATIGELAKTTYLVAAYIQAEEERVRKKLYLNNNEFTRIDAVIFAVIQSQYKLSYNANKHSVIDKINEMYANEVERLLIKNNGCIDCDISEEIIEEMFRNRYEFYKTIMCSNKDNHASMLMKLLDEFEFIIKTDLLSGAYKEYRIDSPVAIIDYDRDIECQIELSFFPAFTKYLLDDHLKKLERDIRLI